MTHEWQSQILAEMSELNAPAKECRKLLGESFWVSREPKRAEIRYKVAAVALRNRFASCLPPYIRGASDETIDALAEAWLELRAWHKANQEGAKESA